MQNSKVAWLESQYLYPHHFQQQERYFEQLIEARCAAIETQAWGVRELVVDSGALAQGRFALVEAIGILPDGTPFELPRNGALPAPIVVPATTKQMKVHLVLATWQAGSRYLDADAAPASGRVVRYRLRMQEVFDYSTEGGASEAIEVAVPNFGLALESEDLGGYSTLAVAEIREVTAEGAVILESAFIPPVLSVRSSPRLATWLTDTIGLIRQRAEALAARFNQAGGSSAIADFLLLQTLNRYEPRLRHFESMMQLHPERLFSELLGLMGELASFTTVEKRPELTASYNHGKLYDCFHPLMDRLSRYLSAVLEQNAVGVPIEKREFGIHVARLADRALLRQATFILTARADLPSDVLRDQLPGAIKVGSVEAIRDLVNNQLPGIAMSALPVAPREIPFHAGSIYFQLDSNSELWSQLRDSGGFAFHIAGDFPSFELELWAIRN